MTAMPTAYDQELTIQDNLYTLTIVPRRSAESFKPVNTNGAQRGWRPIVQLLDHRISDVRIVDGEELSPVVADDFVLVPNPRTVDPSQTYRIQFTATRM